MLSTHDITFKRFLIILAVVLFFLFISICIAYVITSNDIEGQVLNNENNINTTKDNIRSSDELEEYFDDTPSNLLLELSNCYYEIYDSGLLKRSENFDIDSEVKKQITDFQNFVPTALWIDHYKEQCLLLTQ